MQLWEREIVAIQKKKLLLARCVIIIEPHRGLREMLGHAIALLDEEYYTVSMTFLQAEQWLQERECEQIQPSIFLVDCSLLYELSQAEHFLAQLRASKTSPTRSAKAIVMTEPGPSFHFGGHPDVDGILSKPFQLKELRSLILSCFL